MCYFSRLENEAVICEIIQRPQQLNFKEHNVNAPFEKNILLFPQVVMIIPNTPTFVLQLHHVETTATITKLGRKKTVKSRVECVKVSSMVRSLRNTNRVQKKVGTQF